MKNSVLIVGLGNIGLIYDYNKSLKYIETLSKAFFKNPSFNLLGAVDTSIKKTLLFKKKFDLPAYNSIEKAINKLKPNIIVIAVNTEYHLKIINYIFSFYRPNIIFCEKPIAYSYQDSLKIKELCKKNRCKIFINYSRRSLKKFKTIKKKYIFNNNICNVYYSRGFINNGSHFLNLSEFFFGRLLKINVFYKKKIDKNDFYVNFSAKFEKANVNFFSTKNITTNFFNIINNKYFIKDFNKNTKIYKINKIYNGKQKNVLKNIYSSDNKIQLSVTSEFRSFLDNHSLLCDIRNSIVTQKNINRVIND